MIYNNILETIGKTPLIKLSSLQKEGRATILAVESRNRRLIKDRPALIDTDAEKKVSWKKAAPSLSRPPATQASPGSGGAALAR